jgi:hypothetical protein
MTGVESDPVAKDRSMQSLLMLSPATFCPGVRRYALALATVFTCEQSLADQPGLNCEVRAAASALGDQFGRDRPTQSAGHATQKLRVAGKRLSQVEHCERWLAFDPGSALLLAGEQPGRGGNAAEQETTPAKPEPVPPALQRILASWKSREESLRNLHVTWGVPTLLRSDLLHDGKGHDRANRPEFIEAVLRMECLLDGENRFRVEIARPGVPKSSGSPLPLWHRRIFNGKTITETDWPEDAGDPPAGRIFKPAKTPVRGPRPFDPLQLLVAYHPFYRGTTSRGPAWASPAEFRLVTENAIRDNRHFVKLQRLNAAGVVIENLWVDPARGDVVAFLEQTWRKRPIRTLAFRYQHDPKRGWLPASWSIAREDGERTEPTNVAAVIDFTSNENFPAGTFAVKFPSGTTVFDETTKEQYRVAADGSKAELLKVDSPAALRIYQALQTKADFLIEPEPLKDALDTIAQRVGIPIVIDQKGFEDASIDMSTEVVINTKGLKVREILDSLSTQCPQRLRYRIRKDVLFVEPHPSTK